MLGDTHLSASCSSPLPLEATGPCESARAPGGSGLGTGETALNSDYDPQPFFKGTVLGVALACLGLHLLSVGVFAYGYMSDELYYLDCAERLAWGYVDHPPLSIAVLKMVRVVLGDSLLALRFTPALLASALVLIAGLLARELGGGRAAQGLAALTTALCPVFLGVTSFYSMNAFELVFFALASLIVARIVNTEDPRLWLLLGAVLGLGLLNKVSMSWFAIGLAVGVLLTPQRRWIATPLPYAGALLALLLFLPHIIWQIEFDWPTVEFMRNASSQKMISKSPATFAMEQVMIMNPVLAPFWVAGLLHYFLLPSGRIHQIQAWIWISVAVLLVVQGTVRANYLAPAYIPLLAGGGVALERLVEARGWTRLPVAVAGLFTIAGLAVAPLGLPLLPPERYAAFERLIGVSAPLEEKADFGDMPLHFALRFGWQNMIDAVAAAHATLTPDEKEHAVVFGSWFGSTGAVNFFGPERGLPRAISAHNNYWLWGPGDASGQVVLFMAEDNSLISQHFERVERVAEIDCRHCMPAVDRLGIYACRGLREPLAEIWAKLKHYQ